MSASATTPDLPKESGSAEPGQDKQNPEAIEEADSPASKASSDSSNPEESPEPEAADAEPTSGKGDTGSVSGAPRGDPSAPQDAPPLPDEPVPESEDDGWEFHWRQDYNSYIFYNRFTKVWQWDNPRIPQASSSNTGDATTAPGVTPAGPADASSSSAPAISAPGSIAGGYNPAIHGDYDPNAWYAQGSKAGASDSTQAQELAAVASDADPYASTGRWQNPEQQGAEYHGDEGKSRRQLHSFFDVDAAANAHDGRSLRAERAGKKPTKAELKMFKEKRRAKKEEKRRAWLRD